MHGEGNRGGSRCYLVNRLQVEPFAVMCFALLRYILIEAGSSTVTSNELDELDELDELNELNEV